MTQHIIELKKSIKKIRGAMDSFGLFGILAILRESIKIISRNRKLMAFIAIHSVILYNLLFIASIFSIKFLLKDLLLKGSMAYFQAMNTTYSPDMPNPLPGLKRDFRILIGVETIFIIACSILSFSITTATILVSVMSYFNKSSSVRELAQRVISTLKRPLITCFYTTLFILGFYSLFITILFLSLAFYSDNPVVVVAIAIVLCVFMAIGFCYLAVILALALVISVIEENCYGIEAIGKAGALIKGKKLDGFVLNVVIALLSVTASQIFKINPEAGFVRVIIYGMVNVTFSCLVGMFQNIAYTVLYFQCKNYHGEEVDMHGSSAEYIKVYSAQLDDEDMA